MTFPKSYFCLSIFLFVFVYQMKIEAATLGDGLNYTTLEWSTGGTPSSMLPNENVKWWYCSGDGVSDNACVSSGGGSGGITTSWLETTITGPCIISFHYKIMTYNGTFTVQCDNDNLYEFTGITGISPIWKFAEYTIPAGTHRLTFTYRHPGQGYAFVQNGFNGVRIDDFRVKTEAKPPYTSQYLVIDLSRGKDADTYPVYFSETGPDLTSDKCRTTEIWLRRISKGSFVMGSPTNELGRFDEERQHHVTISNDFYIGMFECTQKQYELVMGNNPSRYLGDCRPVENLSYDDIRGTLSNTYLGWPEQKHLVSSSTVLGKLQKKTGLIFDLPTEAQWEYACRAGTSSSLNSGKNLNSLTSDNNMHEVGRDSFNCFSSIGGYSQHTRVGSYLPNAWGLYDMHGNVSEWCLDYYGEYQNNDTIIDPMGPYTGDARINRGGDWNDESPKWCRSAARRWYNSDFRYPSRGFRIVLTPDTYPNLVVTSPSDTIETDGLLSLKEAATIVKEMGKGNIVFNIQNTDILQTGMDVESNVSVNGMNLATGHMMRSEQPVFWSVSSGGELRNIIIGNNDNMRDGGDMFNKGGLLENVTANSGGDIYILGGISKEILVRNNGALFLNEQHIFSTPCSFSEIVDVCIQYGGLLVQKGNVIMTGKLEIAGGMISKDVKGNSIVNQESEVILDLSSWTPSGSFTFTHYHHNYIGRKTISLLVDNISYLKDAGSIAIKVSEQQTLGTYNIAGNANNFDKQISLTIGEEKHSKVLSLGKSFLYGDYSYTLKNISNTLQLVIGEIPKLKDLTINGRSTTSFGSNNSYEVMATYEDGSTRRINPTWTLSFDDYVDLSPDGILQIRDLPLNLQLNATYTEKGVSKSSSFDVTTSFDVSSTSIFEYTYEFNPGWQLVGIVMNLDETSKASLLALKPFCFNNNCYVLANDLPAGTSCWIFVPQKTILKVSGTPCGVLKTKQ